MQPARRIGIANRFAHGHGERDDVVLDLGFQLVNARNVHARPLAQFRRRLARHRTGFRQRIGGCQLNFQPLLEAVLVAPDAAHFCACVSRNQIWLPPVWLIDIDRLRGGIPCFIIAEVASGRNPAGVMAQKRVQAEGLHSQEGSN